MNRLYFTLTILGMVFFAIERLGLSAGEKSPVPNEAELKAANEFLEKKFHTNLPKSDSAKTKKLIDSLYKELKLQDEHPDVAYAILSQISYLASTTYGLDDDLQTALQKMYDRFDLDRLDLRCRVVREFPDKRETLHDGAFDQLIKRTIKEAMDNDRYDIARELADMESEHAMQEKYMERLQQIRAIVENLDRCERQYLLIAAEIRTLKENPADEKAALAVGKFRYFILKNEEQGLLLLRASGDADLSGLASKELQKPSTVDDQRKTADDWYAYRKVARDEAQEHSQRRALYWYRELLLGLDPPDQIIEVKQRIANLEQEIPIGPIPERGRLFSFEKSTWRKRTGSEVTAEVRPIRDSVGSLAGSYGSIQAHGAQISEGRAGQGISVSPHRYATADIKPLFDLKSESICFWVNSREFQDLESGDFILGNSTESSKQTIQGKNGKSAVVSAGPIGSCFRFGPSFASYSFANGGQWLNLRTRESIKLKTNTWYHLAGTRDGASMKFYLNGHLQFQQAYRHSKQDANDELWRIGKGDPQGNVGFNGILDELAHYRRALSAEEVDTLYRLGLAGKPFDQ